MAIAIDSTSSAKSANNVTSLTFSHTVGTLSNGLAVVGVAWYQLATTITGITFGGVAMTRAKRVNNGAAAATSEIWYLVAPASGSNSVVISFSGSTGSSANCVAVAATFSGVDQSTPTGSTGGAVVTGSHTTHSDSITTARANSVVVDMISWATAGGISGLSALGSQANVVVRDASPDTDCGSLSTLATSAAGSYSMGWNFNTTGSATAHSLVELNAAASSITVSLTGLGISSGSMGTPTIRLTYKASLLGIAAGGIGVPTLNLTYRLSPLGIVSAQAFGVPYIGSSLRLSAVGIAPGGIGVPTLKLTYRLSPLGIASAAAFGVPYIGSSLRIAALGIASGGVGVPTFKLTYRLSPVGIPSEESFGSPFVGNHGATIVVQVLNAPAGFGEVGFGETEFGAAVAEDDTVGSPIIRMMGMITARLTAAGIPQAAIKWEIRPTARLTADPDPSSRLSWR